MPLESSCWSRTLRVSCSGLVEVDDSAWLMAVAEIELVGSDFAAAAAAVVVDFERRCPPMMVVRAGQCSFHWAVLVEAAVDAKAA